MNDTQAACARTIKSLRQKMDACAHDIDTIAKNNIPDFSFLDHEVSAFMTCEKSPIGMCVFNCIEGVFNLNCKCRYCGDPVERK